MKNPYTVYNYKPGEILNNGHKCVEPEDCCDDIKEGHTYHILWNHDRHYDRSPPDVLLSNGWLIKKDYRIYYICADIRVTFFIEKGYEYLGVGVIHSK